MKSPLHLIKQILQVVDCLMCCGVGVLASCCLKKREKKDIFRFFFIHLRFFLFSFFSSKMIGNCLEISNFNWLFLELGRFIYYTLPVLPVECPTNIYFIHSAPPPKRGLDFFFFCRFSPSPAPHQASEGHTPYTGPDVRWFLQFTFCL